MKPFISGIQQVGIGVQDIDEAWKWYRKAFGMDIQVFRDSAEAEFMAPYTGNTVHARTALLALNLAGGGGFEIWQFTSRTPENAGFTVLPGDLGINSITLKTSDIDTLFALHGEMGVALSESIMTDPSGRRTYFLRDPYENLFHIVASEERFAKTGHPCGGVCGVTIGVKEIDAARPLYEDVLGYGERIYDVEGYFPEEYTGATGGEHKLHRLLLGQSRSGRGTFGRLFGSTEVELISVHDREPRKIYENRFWGDCGFIHLCFDVHNTDALKQLSAERGFPFTIDSGSSFDMGQAEGRFAYTEDPDGTLIEMVETFKMPLLAQANLFLDLKKRNPEKPLPKWMLKALRFSRVR